LEAFTRTYKFNLFAKQLTPKEKQGKGNFIFKSKLFKEIKNILNEIQKNGAGSAEETNKVAEKFNC